MVAHICQTNNYLIFGLTNYEHSTVFYYERQKECLLVYIQTALLTLVYTLTTLLTLMYTLMTLLTLMYTQMTLLKL